MMNVDVKSWFLKEGMQTYGLILLGMLLVAGFGEAQFGMAVLQALTGTDFVATSFAFIFGAMFAKSIRESSPHLSITMWYLCACILYFALIKIFPLTIPNAHEEFAKINPKVRILWYSLFSISSVIFTLVTIKQIRLNESGA